MKPFKINRDSWHYKLNKHFMNEDQYWMDRWEARHNNFCSYWRATVFRTIFLLLIVVAVVFTIGALTYVFVTDPVGSSIAIAAILGIVAIPIIGILITGFFKDSLERLEIDKNPSIIVQRYKMYKSKICPSVEYDK